VDNIFILVEAFDSFDPSLSVEERLGLTMEKVGSSIMMASLSETFAFLLGNLPFAEP